jgi:hypothetical protein
MFAIPVDLPDLPGDTQRQLSIQQVTLIEYFCLTGEHLSWHEHERARLFRWRGEGTGSRGPDGQWQPSEDLVDRKAIDASKGFAKERCDGLARAYFDCWSPLSGHEGFALWLDVIKRQVLDELATLWAPRASWYERCCQKTVEKAIDGALEDHRHLARQAELKSLQPTIATGAAGPTPVAPSSNWASSGNAPGRYKSFIQEPQATTVEPDLEVKAAIEPRGPASRKRPTWAAGLQEARGNKGLSRTKVSQLLRQRGLQITPEGIKKHEEGHMPKEKHRSAYAEIYGKPSAELFPPEITG